MTWQITMGLAKKGSYAISVDAHQYRWAVSPDSGFMDLVIQDASGRGQRVSIAIDYDDKVVDDSKEPGKSRHIQTRQVTPASVKAMIQKSIALGWEAAAPGGSIRFHSKGETLERQTPR